MGREASRGYARVGSGRAASAAPPSPRGPAPRGAPLLQPLSNPHDGGGGRFRAAPSSPERTQPVPFHKHPGKQMQGKWASSPGPHFHGQPLPRGLCISLPWFSIALATSAHTGVSMGNSGPALAHKGRLGHRAASGVCSHEGEPQPWGSRGICPRDSQCPNLTHLLLSGDVKVRGGLGDHLAGGIS